MMWKIIAGCSLMAVIMLIFLAQFVWSYRGQRDPTDPPGKTPKAPPMPHPGRRDTDR